MSNNVAIRVHNVVKTFPGVRALDRVDFELRKGEVHALVGENGAGKSTLIHILGGISQPDTGTIYVHGKETRLDSARHAGALGIAVVFQELSLASNLSVAENIFFNRQPANGLGIITHRKLFEKTRQILQWFDLELRPNTPAKNLSVAIQQVVEILKAISQNPSVLVLDEPTSSLTSVETRLLFKNLRKFKNQGTSVVYVSHHLPEIFEIADRVTVLRDGRRVATHRIEDVTEEEIVRQMVGRELKNIYGQRTSEIGEEVFRLEEASGRVFRNVSFSLKKGEILGLSGLVGAGRTELGRAIFGVEPLRQGRLYVNGDAVRIRSPKDAIRKGIGYMTEDRKAQGLFLDMTVRQNCAAPNLDFFTNSYGLLDENLMSDFAEKSRSRYRIVTPSVRQKVGKLSGGNQQKVLVAMWMGIDPKILIADEPTRGIDIGAKSDIYQMLRQLAALGVGVIMISSDLIEILGMCDRTLVIRDGQIAGEYTRQTASEDKLIACAAGVGINQTSNN